MILTCPAVVTVTAWVLVPEVMRTVRALVRRSPGEDVHRQVLGRRRRGEGQRHHASRVGPEIPAEEDGARSVGHGVGPRAAGAVDPHRLPLAGGQGEGRLHVRRHEGDGAVHLGPA